jgi:hypothetical protein
MAEIYGTTGSVPGDSVEVRAGGTVAVSAAFNTTVGLVGGYDSANGNATEGEVATIESSAGAASAFGEDSELKAQVDLAFNNGAGLVYAVPVSETSNTETFSGVSSANLAEAPVFDPRVNEEHSIDITDTTESASVTVNLVDGTPTTPTDANTANLNPSTGEIEFDESSDYEVTYEYGDYEGAITEVVKKVPRSLGVCTESTSVANDLLTTLNTYDTDFDFMHGYVGENVDLDDLQNYSQSYDDRRLVAISAARGYTDEAKTNEERTVGAVAGKQAGKPLGDSTTAEGLGGFASLKQSPTNQEAGTLIDAGVYPLQQAGGIKVVKDTTTDSEPKFSRVAWSEIIDEAAEISHTISSSFVGKANTDDNRDLLGASHRTSYGEMAAEDLLDNFFVAVSEGANPNEVNVDIGLDVVDYMDTIDVTITVGDVVVNGGAA